MEVYTIFESENLGGLMFDAILSGGPGGEAPQESRGFGGPQAPQFPSVKLINKNKMGQAKL